MFKKVGNKSDILNTDNGILGPRFLEGFTKHIENPNELHSHEWLRKLSTSSGNRKFKIKYYGELHENYNNLKVETNFAPVLEIAINLASGEEILLFDGCKHGYNSMFLLYFCARANCQ